MVRLVSADYRFQEFQTAAAVFGVVWFNVWLQDKPWPVYLSRYSDSLRAARSADQIPVGGKIFCARPHRPHSPPSLLYNGYRVFRVG
jgi:hypothetical protein